MFARKWDLAWLAFSASSFATCASFRDCSTASSSPSYSLRNAYKRAKAAPDGKTIWINAPVSKDPWPPTNPITTMRTNAAPAKGKIALIAKIRLLITKATTYAVPTAGADIDSASTEAAKKRAVVTMSTLEVRMSPLRIANSASSEAMAATPLTIAYTGLVSWNTRNDDKNDSADNNRKIGATIRIVLSRNSTR